MAEAVSWQRSASSSSFLAGVWSGVASSFSISCIICVTMQLTTVRVSSLRRSGTPWRGSLGDINLPSNVRSGVPGVGALPTPWFSCL